MDNSLFFHSAEADQINPSGKYCETEDILTIFDALPSNSLLILDIDDTIGRLPHALGIDPWFLFRIDKFISQGLDEVSAKQKAVELYTKIQLASTQMVGIHQGVDMGRAIDALKARGVTVIGLTARNHMIKHNTHLQLASMGVKLSSEAFKNRTFKVHDKTIEMDDGIIFCNGQNKGAVLNDLKSSLLQKTPQAITYVDDSEKNCQHVFDALSDWPVEYQVCHYQYRQRHLPFEEKHKIMTFIQEAHFLAHKAILPDDNVSSRLRLNEEFLTGKCHI